MGEIVNILKEIKGGNKEKFEMILERFEPLIKKYVRYLYKDDQEDVRAELNCALWEAILNIGYTDQEGQIINYLQRAMLNRYFELYRNSRKKHDHETEVEEESLYHIQSKEDKFSEVIVNEIKNKIINHYTGKKRLVYSKMLIAELSDTEIAERYGMSRQYVNRLRREMKKDIEKGGYL